MGNLWIRFGCFLTGYNYRIVRLSSEVAAKAVKKYTAAMLIVCILWSFIGYMFTSRYLHGGVWGSVLGAFLMVIIIIQIERQIILSVTPSKWLILSRGLIAGMMAFLGAIIVDQIIFKEDIELEQVNFTNEKVKKLLPDRTADLRLQISNLDTAIMVKEAERKVLTEGIVKNPTIKVVTTQSTPIALTSSKTDSLKNTQTQSRIVNSSSTTVSNMVNPKLAMLEPLDKQIAGLREQKAGMDSSLLTLRPELVKEISSKVGFLDELNVMHSLIAGSGIAFTVWLIWFFFLMGLEMLVLISKAGDKRNDYDQTVLHQMELQMKKLDLMAKSIRGN